MTGTPRTRTRPIKYNYGFSVKLGSTYDRSIAAELSEACDDVVGNTQADNPLTITTGKSNWPAFNGNNGDPNPLGYREYSNYGMGLSWPGYTTPSSATTVSEMRTKLLARTNPGRSHLKLPVFLFELHELPRLVLIEGRSILKRFANANLAWQFGWTPLLSDLRKMFNFQDAVAKRVNELERLQSKSGLKRRAQLKTWDDSTGNSSQVTVESFLSLVYAKYQDQKHRECWGTVRWVPTPGASMPSTDLERLRLARKMVLGFGPGQILANIWEGLPWSWLIDWFSNVGDFIEATNNSIAMPMGTCCLMYHSTSTRTYRIVSKPAWVTCSPGAPQAYREAKQRFAVAASPSVNFSLPFLTGRQLSILGSLWIQRRR